MKYEVKLNTEDNQINFAPSSTLEEIIQNVRNICCNIKGSVPYQRDMGFDENILDLPTNKVAMMFQVDMIKQLKKYEPRAEIKAFDYTGSNLLEGRLTPTLIIEINERYL